MAILKDIEVTIQVDGENIQEYDDFEGEDDRPNGSQANTSCAGETNAKLKKGMPYTVTKYIEAISGARFTIKTRVSEVFGRFSKALLCRYYLDGIRADEALLSLNQERKKDACWVRISKGTKESTNQGSTLRPFMFSEIKRRNCPLQL